MSVKFAVIAIALFASVLSAQWVETTVQAGRNPTGLVWNPVENRVYVCNRGTEENPDSTVYVIDGATNLVLDTIVVGLHPSQAVVDSARDKLFVWCWGDSSIAVVDCRGDTLLTKITGLPHAWPLELAPEVGKLYCCDQTAVIIIDCTADSVMGRIEVTDPGVLGWNPVRKKLYCSCYYEGIVVLDGVGDTTLGTIPTGYWGVTDLCYNPNMDRMYVGGDSIPTVIATVQAIDCATDSVVACAVVGEWSAWLVHNPLMNDLYCAAEYENIKVVDCETHSVVGTIWTPFNSEPALCYNPTSNKVFSSNWESDPIVYVIDGSTRRVIKTLPVGWIPTASCCNPVDNRVYYSDYVTGGVTVIKDSAVVAVAETQPVAATPDHLPTILRNVLNLQSPIANPQSPVALLDISGRKVMDLSPGPNDISHLSPGVYFVHSRVASRQSPPATKVIIQK